MRQKAFTLIEMLVVVCIIALLVAILMPSLGRARSLAHMTACANNLKELGNGIALARLAGGGLPSTESFPATEWPGIPWTLETSHRIFNCPEMAYTANATFDAYAGPGGGGGGSAGTGPSSGGTGPSNASHLWSIHTNQPLNGVNDGGFYYFEDGVDCHVVSGPAPADNSGGHNPFPAILSGHIQYRMDDGWYRDFDDVVWDYDTVSHRMVKVSAGYNGTSDGNNGTRGILGLYYNGLVYPGWDDIGQHPAGAVVDRSGGGGSSGGAGSGPGTDPTAGSSTTSTSFYFYDGTTDYAINSLVGISNVATDTIILLDYNQIKANDSTDSPMRDHLKASSRHLGKINVLYADFSVRASWGLSLDKATNPDPWSP